MIYVFTEVLSNAINWCEINNIHPRDIVYVSTHYNSNAMNKVRGARINNSAYVVLNEKEGYGNWHLSAKCAINYLEGRKFPGIQPRTSIVSLHKFLKENNIELTPTGQGKLDV